MLTQVINLSRRQDRLRQIRQVLKNKLVPWERVEAVDGRALSWDDVAMHLHPTALADALWAEAHKVPTICRRTGSFSPHLTLAAVGCALSHRKAWERLANSSADVGLIFEDDVAKVADDFHASVERVLAQLPSTWKLCWLGYHESSGNLAPSDKRLRFHELPEVEGQTGLFSYLLRRSTAIELLQDKDVFPLRHQIDVMLGWRHWGSGTRFALSPEAVLAHSPKSEDGACDTDVQSLGDTKTKAHSKIVGRGKKLSQHTREMLLL